MAATGDLLFVGGQDSADGIFAFRFDAGSGSLTPLGSALDASSPMEHVNDGEAVGDGGLLASSSDGRFLFATATDSAAAFAIDEASGALSRLGTVPTAIPCPASVALADGLLLLPCYLGGGGVAVVERRADGTLGEEVQTIGPFGAGSNADAARQEEAHPHSGWLSPLGARTVFLVPDLGSDKVRSFVVDVSAKRLVPAGELDLAPGSGPRHLDFHPTLPIAYLISEMGCTIMSFSYNPETGALGEVSGAVSTLPAGFDNRTESLVTLKSADGSPVDFGPHMTAVAADGGYSPGYVSTTADIHVSPSGRFVYGSNRGHDSLVCYSLDAATGEIGSEAVGWTSTGGHCPRNFAIHPSGRWVVAANQDEGTIAVFSADEQTGKLTSVGPLCTDSVGVVPHACCCLFVSVDGAAPSL